MGFITQLAAHGQRAAIVTDTVRLNYLELVDRVNTISSGLAEARVGPACVVGLEIADEVEHLTAALALIAVGARHITLASHDPAMSKEALAVRAKITHHVTLDRIVTRSGSTVTSINGEGVVYHKTSGTTGEMNLIAFTETQLGEQSRRHPEYETERLLRLASIEHNNSKRHRLYSLQGRQTAGAKIRARHRVCLR